MRYIDRYARSFKMRHYAEFPSDAVDPFCIRISLWGFQRCLGRLQLFDALLEVATSSDSNLPAACPTIVVKESNA
jgi:hypothetical protein